MRVFYNNLLETASPIAMTNLDNDSYVANLYHPYLELACFCLASDVTLSGAWADPQTINSISVAYHNCDWCRVKLYDNNNNELLNELITLSAYDNVYYLDDDVAGVYRFTMEFSSGSDVYVGFVYLGEYTELPKNDSKPTFTLALESTKSQSSGGQIYGSFARQLKTFSFEWTRITTAQKNIMEDYLTYVQTCKPHMIDPYYGAHEYVPPCYVTVTSDKIEEKKREEAGFYYSAAIEYKEAR